MNWLTELGKKIAAKMGISEDEPPEVQESVLESIEEIHFEPVKPGPVVTPEETAKKIYNFLNSTCAEGTSSQYRKAELRMRLLKKFPYLKENQLSGIIRKYWNADAS